MGLDIKYTAGEESICFRLSPNDIDVAAVLAKKGFQKEVEDVLGVLDFGEQTSVSQKALSTSVSKLLEAIRKDPKILPYTYGAKEEIPHGSGNYSTGTGIISGFKIDGETYSLELGLDTCLLRRKWQDKQGAIHLDAPKDARNLKVIKVDENSFSGDIYIYKRRKPTKLVRHLQQLQAFLSKTRAKYIQKTLG